MVRTVTEFEHEKCELCGSEALLVSVFYRGRWIRICAICYTPLVVDKDKELEYAKN